MVGVETDPVQDAYQRGAAEGVLMLPQCLDCGRTHWYPRPFCPHCHGRKMEWRRSTGRGIIYSFSIFRRAPEPYAIAYVSIDDGPIMLSNITGCHFDDIAIGKRVKVRFGSLTTADTMPTFTPE